MKPIPPALLAALEAAGFPADLHRFVSDGTLEHYHTEPDGTLRFAVPPLTETRQDTELIWHPEDKKTWRYEDMRFYVQTNFYHDTKRESDAGSELVEISEDKYTTKVDLLLWLEDHSPQVAAPGSFEQASGRAERLDAPEIPPFDAARTDGNTTNGRRAERGETALIKYQRESNPGASIGVSAMQNLFTDLFHWAHREGHNVAWGDGFMRELLDAAHEDFLREARYPVPGPEEAAITTKRAQFLEWHGYAAPEKLVEAWRSGSMPLPEVPALAKEFSRLIRQALSSDELDMVRGRNAFPKSPNTCASHDFCDANVYMGQAFSELGYDTAPDGKDLIEAADAYADVWNAAWDLAKQSGFTL